MSKTANRTEIARIYKVNLGTVDRWLRRGCPAKKDGRNWNFDLKRLMRGLTKGTGSVRQSRQRMMRTVKAKAERMYWNAKRAKLEYERKSGKLINADEVKVAAFNAARTARDNLMNIPDRLAPLLVGVDDSHKIHKLLSDEIRKICEDLSSTLLYKNDNKHN